MQRRKVEAPSGHAAPTFADPAHRGGLRMSHPRRGRGAWNMGSFLSLFLLALGMVLLSAILFPTTVREVEETTAHTTKDFVNNAYQAEQVMEKKVEDLLFHQQGHPLPVRESMDATAAMEQQPSSWVDGEKKLKQKLKVLYERQKQGLDLGVPVLTRYLGEDIPAWVGEGVNETEWRAKVADKYKEMAEQEKEWREKVKAHFKEKHARKTERR